ncbi:hypothetical protein OA101_00680 [Alphaproteobacteria bacterium]|jgi:hypothetical protein|nr:hypothetical protein [Alphaproteobacteria bacterium]
MGQEENKMGWTPELLKQRRRRAAIMGLALGAMVLVFFLVTVVRLMENVASRAG